MKGKLRKWFNGFILATLVFSMLAPAASRAQSAPSQPSPQEQAATLLERLTPEERIGQLFMVTFQGQAVDKDTPIYDLIANHHIGGIVLQAKNDNIATQDRSAEATINGLKNMVRDLQQDEWEASQQTREDPITGSAYQTNYVPLFIGIAQEGDGYPYDQILEGVTALPNEMALGATWTPDVVSQAGRILGQELSGVGVNFLFGPSLDVLDPPLLESASSLSTRTFGGDPYWVGKMGQAFIQGVHQGSQGSVAVAATHFPGYGSSDRLPEEEVATVRKSLDELISFDLAPFLAVTGTAANPGQVTDALVTSHIRYQGLQGNIRATTRPVSFDPQALSLLFQQPALSTWRANGGIMISDDLGNQAVRRFYDLTSQPFDARRVALNAFLAGNDLLYIADFSSQNAPDSVTEAIRTLDFFTQKYQDDAAFAQRVNESVQRILTLKFKLYPNYQLDRVRTPAEDFQPSTGGNQVVFSIAQQAATLVSPSQAELDSTIPDPPNLNDRIVFITDTRTYQQCSKCTSQPELSIDALQNSVVRLYGPQAGGQVVINNLTSHSIDELQKLLDRHPDQKTIEQDLERANWIVFSLLSDQPDASAYQVLRRFLNERPDLFQKKRLIVFAFTAPYYLDATDISKLSAYFALYSKASPFVDVAAYLLFGELRPTGAPPVSVPGINYNLNEALFPDPGQSIPLFFDIQPGTPITNTVTTPEPTLPPDFHLGDVIPLRTGLILDQNRHPVPDGTPVNFYFNIAGESTSARQTEYTHDGIARTKFAVKTGGALEIRAESENAISAILRVDIPLPSGETATATNPAPTATPTTTPITPVVPPTLAPPVTITPTSPVEPPRLWLGDWLLAVLSAMAMGFLVYRLAAMTGQIRWGIRAGLLSLISGLVSYSYLAWLIWKSQPNELEVIGWSVLLTTIAGGIAGLVITLVWRFLAGRVRPPLAYVETPKYNTPSHTETPAPEAESAHQSEGQAGEQ